MAKLLSSLPVGSLVIDTGTVYNGENPVFRVLEHGHTGDPTGSTTLEFRDVIAFRCFDAMEPQNTNSDRKTKGNNRYLYSNLLQWLNSEEYANEWYISQHSVDTPPSSDYIYKNLGISVNPYDSENGFLTNLSPSLNHALMTVTKTVAKNAVTDGGGSETVSSKLFLLSSTEIGLTDTSTPVEGILYSFYNSSSETICDKYAMNELVFGNDTWEDITKRQQWWLRSPNTSSAYLVYIGPTSRTEGKHVSAGGAATGACGVSPAFCIPSNTYVSDNPDSKGVYTIMWGDTYIHDDRIINVGNLRTFKELIENVVDDKIEAQTPATTTTNGLMSSTDKSKLDGIDSISTSFIDNLFT